MGQVFLYPCILGPSVFMISLGSNLVFSDANPRKIVKRGCTTLIAFLLLNIVRDGIPDVVVALTGHPSTLDTFEYDILRPIFWDLRVSYSCFSHLSNIFALLHWLRR